MSYQLNATIGADVRPFKEAAAKMEAALKPMSERMKSIGQTLSTRVTAPLAALGTAAVVATARLGNLADRILDLEQQTGLTTDQLQAFGAVARNAGVPTDALANAAQGLQRRLSATGDESARFKASVEALGVETRDSSGQLRSMSDLMPELVNRLSRIENVAERNALATRLFGGAANDLIPVLSMGAEEIDRLTQAAHANGEVMTREQLEAANRVRQAFAELRQGFANVGREITVALVPAVTKLAELANENLVPAARRVGGAVAGVMRGFSELSPRLQIAIGGLVGVAAAAGPVLYALGSLIAIAPKVAAAWALMFGPLGLTVIALTAAGTAIWVFRDKIKEALNRAAAAFADFQADLLDWAGKIPGILARVEGALGVRGVFSRLSEALDKTTSKLRQNADEWRGWADAVLGATARVAGGGSGGGGGAGFGGGGAGNSGTPDPLVLEPNEKMRTMADVMGDLGQAAARTGALLRLHIVDAAEAATRQAGDLRNAIEAALDVAGNRATAAIEDLRNQMRNARLEAKALGLGIMQATHPAIKDFEAVSEAALRLGNQALAAVNAKLEEMGAGAQKGTSLFADLRWGIAAVSEQIGGLVADSLSQLSSAFGRALAGAQSFTDAMAGAVSGVMNTIGDMAIRTGVLAMGIGKAIEAIRNALMSFFGFGAIAAGAALISLGVAAKMGAAAIASGGGGVSGGGASPSGVTSIGVNANAFQAQAQTVRVEIVGTRTPAGDIEWSGREVTRRATRRGTMIA